MVMMSMGIACVDYTKMYNAISYVITFISWLIFVLDNNI